MTLSLRERLSAKIQPDTKTGCLNFTGCLVAGGYGQISGGGPGRKRLRAHRVAYELAHGPIPAGFVLDHLCRNRRCCNPDHLEVVSPRENTLRGESFAATNARKTHCAQGHLFSEENIWMWRGQRRCRACRRLSRSDYGRRCAAVRRSARAALGDGGHEPSTKANSGRDQ